jgi:hypothetical protein
MQVDNNPFPINVIDLQGAKVLIRLEQDESTKGKNVIIGEKRCKGLDDKFWSRKVAKAADGKEALKITLNGSKLGGGGEPTTRSEIEGLFNRRHKTDRSDR